MIWLFKKPKVVFQCCVPGVEKIMPIIPAKDYKHAWTARAHQEYVNLKKEPGWGMSRFFHTARCPGIFNLQKQGWIQRTWLDITIETFGDGYRFEWTSALDQSQLSNLTGGSVGSHASDQYFNYMQNWGEDTLKTIVKIQSPWRCKIPEGYYLMKMPIPYADEVRFTTLPGIFDSDMGTAPLNVQMLWHVPKGKVLIKAGTPVAQYVLIPKKKFDYELEVVSNPNGAVFEMLLKDSRFVPNYDAMRTILKEQK